MPVLPPGAGTGRAGRWHRPRWWRLLLVPVAVLALVVAAACDAGSAVAPSARNDASTTCRLSSSMMVAAWPDLIPMFREAHSQLPGSHGIASHPRSSLTQYVCGQYDGFAGNDIMYGKYRAENNALARSLGYQTGKWPLLPVVGQVISALPHGLFEAYEEAYQFRTTAAAAAWLASARWEPVPPKNMAVSLPTNFIARAGVAGKDDGTHEHGIGISGQIGATVLVVSFHGGRELSWPDIRSLWTMAYDRFTTS
jgi:hypothetical protein